MPTQHNQPPKQRQPLNREEFQPHLIEIGLMTSWMLTIQPRIRKAFIRVLGFRIAVRIK